MYKAMKTIADNNGTKHHLTPDGAVTEDVSSVISIWLSAGVGSTAVHKAALAALPEDVSKRMAEWYASACSSKVGAMREGIAQKAVEPVTAPAKAIATDVFRNTVAVNIVDIAAVASLRDF